MAAWDTQVRCFVGTWWSDIFERVEEVNGSDKLFQCLAEEAEELGFQYCSYGIRFPTAASHGEPSVKVFDSYPKGWMEHYLARSYILVDPTVIRGAQCTESIVWSDDLFLGSGSLWRDAKEHGLRIGIAQPAWASQGVYGLLSLARSRVDISETELRELRPRVGWLAECAHRKMQSLLNPRVSDAPDPLSRRETEVLKWTADGKTAWEISQILRISESTVAFHLRNINSKLGSQTKVQAVALAASLGLLSRAMVPERVSRPQSDDQALVSARSR